jgi:nucleoside-diphosphate-sugar epimerase
MNVASGRSVLIRTIYDTFCRLAGVSAPTVVDPALVRGGEPANLYGLAHRLTAATGWTPQIHLERSLADVWMEGTYGRSRDRPR